MQFYFFNENTFKKYDFKKNPQVKITSRSKVRQFLFFHCDVMFDNLEKFGQISSVIPYYLEIKALYIWANFSSNILIIGTN